MPTLRHQLLQQLGLSDAESRAAVAAIADWVCRLHPDSSLLSLSKLQAAGQTCDGTLGADSSSSSPQRLLLGWLGTIGGDDGDAFDRLPAAGMLSLSDGARSTLPCSVVADAVPAPELRGCLVLATAWRYVPPSHGGATRRRSAGGLGGRFELDGHLVRCLGPRQPLPPRLPLPAWPSRAFGDGGSARRGGTRRRRRPFSAVLEKVALQLAPTRCRAPAQSGCGAGKRKQPGDDAAASSRAGRGAGRAAPGSAALLHVVGCAVSVSELVLLGAGEGPPTPQSDERASGTSGSSRASSASSSTQLARAGAEEAFFLLELGPGRREAAASGGAAGGRVVILFSGRSAVRWHALLSQGREYRLASLQPCVLDRRWHVLRSTRFTAVWREEGGPAAAPPLAPLSRAPSICCAELASQSRHMGHPLGSQAAALPSPASHDGSGTTPPSPSPAAERGRVLPVTASTLIDYEGEVTERLSACCFRVDGEWTLLTPHAPLRLTASLRAGAKVRLVDVHPLHVPREPEAEQGSAGQSRGGKSNGFRLFGFGLCGRSRVEILRHAPCGGGREGGGGGEGAADDRAGGEGGCEIRRLGLRLGLSELARFHSGLQAAWREKWRGVLTPPERVAALEALLGSAGLGPLRTASASPAGGGGGRFLSQFCGHRAGGCRLCEARAPLPYAPTLLEVLRSRPVASLLQRSGRLEQQQLLSGAGVASSWQPTRCGPHRPAAEALRLRVCDGGCRQPPLVLVGEVALAAPPAPHNFVLRDCTAEIPLALPPHQMAAGALLLGNVVALASFELLALPQLLPPAVGQACGPESASAALCVRCHSLQAQWGAGGGGAVEALLEGGSAVLLHHSHRPAAAVAAAAAAGAASGSIASEDPLAAPLLVRPIHIPLRRAPAAEALTMDALVCLEPQAGAGGAAGASGAPGVPAWQAPPGSWELMTLLLPGRRGAQPPLHARAPLLQLGAEYAVRNSGLRNAGPSQHGATLTLSCGARIEYVRSQCLPPSVSLLQLLTLPEEEARCAINVRCVLLSLSVRAEARSSSVQFALSSLDGRQAVMAYLSDLSKVRLPAGLLPGASLLLTRARLRWSNDGAGKRYLALSPQSGIHVRAAQPRLEGEEVALAGAGGGRTIEQLSLQVKVPPSVRLLVAVVRLVSFSFRWRCCACGQVREAGRCGCSVDAVAGSEARFEAWGMAIVDDGTGRAVLELNGLLVWPMLQASDSIVDGVAAAARAVGPLSLRCGEANHKECLSLGRGQWQCAPGASIGPEQRRALDAAMPRQECWQRRFVTTCRRVQMASTESRRELTNRQRVRVRGQDLDLEIVYGFPKLQALHLEAASPRMELERLLRGS